MNNPQRKGQWLINQIRFEKGHVLDVEKIECKLWDMSNLEFDKIMRAYSTLKVNEK